VPWWHVSELVEQLAGGDAKPSCDGQRGRQPRLVLSALEASDQGQLQARELGQAVLREAFTLTQFPHALTKSAR
jgi:hypothetical protein